MLEFQEVRHPRKKDMNNTDLTLALMLLSLLILHLLFCYRAITSTQGELNQLRRYSWGFFSLCFGPLGYYLYQSLLPLEQYD
ncbi:hypothetical protein Sden_2314 [Shewanella denitrificans OS217]|uniref:Uncharacterized protein n=2 Tax=Shewanella TaxID=22 RepID=Q12LT2_SHEDO|nr:hypothetical protein Sden_2314 [Shewanella denitrificans OS217]